MPKKTIKIFLASSGTLQKERKTVDALISAENRRLNTQDIFLDLVIWEELSHSFRGERIQDYFNREMLKCDVVFALFFDKVGQFTLEEFEKAHANLKARKKPRHLFVFFKDSSVKISVADTKELNKIRKLRSRIEKEEQIYGTYRTTESLKIRIKEQLDKIVKPFGTVKKTRVTTSQKAVTPAITPPLKKFLAYQLQQNRFLPMQGFETTLRVPIELERVYVCMRANVGNFMNNCMSFDHMADARHKGDGFIASRRRRTGGRDDYVDIKGAFAALEQLKVKDMIILGDPGSGKTTLLKYILVLLIDRKAPEKLGIANGPIPVFVPLRDLKNPNSESFEQFLHRVCRCADYKIDEHCLIDLLDTGNAVVLLDGLDEVADEELRVAACRWIDDARRRYINTRFILTSRFSGYLGRVQLTGLPVLELSIQNFTPSEVRAFLERWFETVYAAMHPGAQEKKWRAEGRKEAQKLSADIESSEHVKKLAVNPLLLQIIALIRHDRGTKLPERRVELYQECIDVLLEKWDMAKGLPVMLSAKESREVLQPIALWLHGVEGRRSATIAGALDAIVAQTLGVIGKSNITPSALLRNIRDRAGLFMGYGTDEYGFTHLSFQEYLAAEQLRNEDNIGILVDNYGSKWWREVILLALGLTNPSIIEKFMAAIVKTKPFRSDISIIQDAVRDSIRKPVVVFRNLLLDGAASVEARQNALRILESISSELAIEALREAAVSDDQTIARAAYTALVRKHATKGLAPVRETVPQRLTWEKDGSEMALVPAGMFLYGSRVDDKNAENSEKPQQSLYVPDFYISIYPVTNAQYKKFVDETGHPPPDKAEWGNPVWKGNDFPADKANHPVVWVSWDDAAAYAKWAGLRLPGEVEWEKAARGTDGRTYPWGNRWDAKRCNCEVRYNGTTEVDKFKNGISPFGCHDMAGNVWEWCMDRYSGDNDKAKITDLLKGPDSGSGRVLRGGSWYDGARNCRSACRGCSDPDDRYDFAGFRVVFVPQ